MKTCLSTYHSIRLFRLNLMSSSPGGRSEGDCSTSGRPLRILATLDSTHSYNLFSMVWSLLNYAAGLLGQETSGLPCPSVEHPFGLRQSNNCTSHLGEKWEKDKFEPAGVKPGARSVLSAASFYRSHLRNFFVIIHSSIQTLSVFMSLFIRHCFV